MFEKDMTKLTGLATGIGSFPYKEVDEALDLIFKYTPQIPFWPQLPKRDPRERMLAQFSENLPCLEVVKGELQFNGRDRDKGLEAFYERVIANDVDYFKISRDYAYGLHGFYKRLKDGELKDISAIKCHVCGPFSFAAGVNDDKGVSLLHDPVLMQAIIKGLAMKALWQIKFFREFGKEIIVFFDEPYLGCFGSAYTPINRDDVVKGLTELTEPIKSQNALTGIHCCGNTDWSIFTQIETINIISFDAFSFLDKFVLYAGDIRDFLKRGGIICWGIVPTQGPGAPYTAAMLAERINEGIDKMVKKGVDRGLLLKNLMLSPACGLGALELYEPQKIFSLLAQVSALMRNPQ